MNEISQVEPYGPSSRCSITDCILTYIMYFTVCLSQYTTFHLLHRKLRAVNRNIRTTQYIIYVRIQPVILHRLNGPYTAPYRSNWGEENDEFDFCFSFEKFLQRSRAIVASSNSLHDDEIRVFRTDH